MQIQILFHHIVRSYKNVFQAADSQKISTQLALTLLQILIELETALLDDMPHWYKLQTHDSSSIPLPQPSPYLPRRHVHGESPSKKLQSMFFFCVKQRCLSSDVNLCAFCASAT